MLKANVYSLKGTKLSTTSLPKSLEAKDLPAGKSTRLLSQAIRVYEERAHMGLADTKTRSEVNRTKKKWYAQKGTGGARHGSRSAPIFVGGGVAHGPKPTKRELTLPKKMAKRSLSVALSRKARNKELVVLDGLNKLQKTKDGQNLINKLTLREGKGAKRFTFILSEENKNVTKALRNIKNVKVELFKNLNAYKVLFGGMLIFDRDIFGKKRK